MNNSVSNAFNWCRRYISLPLIVIVAYIVFVVYFNENSYSKSASLQAEIDRLEAEIKDNKDTMLYYQQLNKNLVTDAEALERVVREKYHMQRADEDVYVFED